MRKEHQVSPPETLHETWEQLGKTKTPIMSVPTTDKAWHSLEGQLRQSLRPPRPPNRQTIRRRVAGGFALTIILAGFWWVLQPIVVVAPSGTQTAVQLPDGSTALLNSHSRLKYNRLFAYGLAPNRQVSLEGEAYFEVLPDAQHPFIVKTFNSEIQVLGTTFNVRARRGQPNEETRVSLASGQVRLRARGKPTDDIILSKSGQIGFIKKNNFAPMLEKESHQSLEHILAWKNKGFAAVKLSLKLILSEIEYRFNVMIRIEGPLNLADEMTLMYPQNASAEKILYDICLAQGWQYRQNSRGFIVSQDTSP